MPDTNHVLLLRHCIRSTTTTISTCDGDIEKKVNISDYLSAEVTDFGVPPYWCTEKGLDVIEEQGRYLIDEILVPLATSGPLHLQINLISDLSHRDVDTTVALATGMKEALRAILNSSSTRVTFGGLDDFTISRDIFKPEGNGEDDRDALCPLTEYTLRDWSDQIADRIVKYLPYQKVQEMIDLVIRLGGVKINGPFGINSFHYNKDDPSRCSSDALGFQLHLLKQIGEIAAYSRASGIFPPFLPNATNDEVYEMLNMVDMLRTLEKVDNIRAAKYGLVLAKSMLAALQVQTPSGTARGGLHTSTIIIFVGHDSNIDYIATAFGLQWKLPHRQGLDGFDDMVSTPPGSGLLFTSKGDDPMNDLSVSYIYQENMIEQRVTNARYRKVGVFATNRTNERDRQMDQNIKSTKSLQKRLNSILLQYPELHTCFDRAPIIPQNSTIMAADGASLGVAKISLMALVAFNLLFLLYNLMHCVRFKRNQSKYQDFGAVVKSQTADEDDQLELT